MNNQFSFLNVFLLFVIISKRVVFFRKDVLIMNQPLQKTNTADLSIAIAKNKMAGYSMFEMTVVAIIVLVFGLIAVRVSPSLIEYKTISQAVNRAALQPSANDVMRSFDAIAIIDNITTITSQDLIIDPVGDKMIVKYDYRKEISLAGPVSLVIHFSGRSK